MRDTSRLTQMHFLLCALTVFSHYNFVFYSLKKRSKDLQSKKT